VTANISANFFYTYKENHKFYSNVNFRETTTDHSKPDNPFNKQLKLPPTATDPDIIFPRKQSSLRWALHKTFRASSERGFIKKHSEEKKKQEEAYFP
jgi:hypothetical protein